MSKKNKKEAHTPFVQHVAGVPCLGLQRCVECGVTLFDYRNAMVANSSPAGLWPTGPVYNAGNFWCTSLKKGAKVVECKDVDPGSGTQTEVVHADDVRVVVPDGGVNVERHTFLESSDSQTEVSILGSRQDKLLSYEEIEGLVQRGEVLNPIDRLLLEHSPVEDEDAFRDLVQAAVKYEDEETRTERNMKVVSAFMEHCKEAGVEIAEQVFLDFFEA